MNADEFSDLAAMWSAPAAPAERKEVEHIARQTPRRAWLGRATELGFAGIIAACVVAAMAWRLDMATLVTGSLIVLLLAWSAWKRHRLGNLALLVDCNDRATYVDSLIRAKEAELRRSAIGLALILPGTLLAALLSFLVHTGGQQLSFAEFIPGAMLTLRGFIALALLASAVTLLTLSHLRLIGEVAALHALGRDYARETRRDGPGRA